MNKSQVDDRLTEALNHRYDEAKVLYAEREKNRKHNAKYKENNRASQRRRMTKPKNKISAKCLSRLRWLIRHPEFHRGKFPKSDIRAKAIPYAELLGADAVVFREHMGSLFNSGMTWENYGPHWQIGHRVPIRLFDCSDVQQLKACFYYQNLQPELPAYNQRRLGEIGNS